MNILPFLGVTGILFWFLWVLRTLFGRKYKPYIEEYSETASVIVPSYREDFAVLNLCLTSIEKNNPKEIFLLIDDADIAQIEKLRAQHPKVNVIKPSHNEPDKRNSMAHGVSLAIGNIVVFVDSDVTWEENTLKELLKPFKNKKIGGVCSKQVIDNEDKNLWTTLNSWLLNMALKTGVPFQAINSCVSCLRGRTAAYRRSLFTSDFMEAFTNEVHFGVRAKPGDDGRLTFLTLKAGYGTFYQSTSVVHTMAPETFKGLLENRLRCNRNTFRRYFGSITQRWFWNQNWRFKVEFVASVIIPLGFIFCTYSFVYAITTQNWIFCILHFAWFNIGRTGRSPRWSFASIRRLLYMPLIVLCFLFPLLVVRWYAFLTMNNQGWLTRK